MDFNFPKRIQNSHKGTYGKLLNISGSEFYTGAAYLSSIAALKVGCGYVVLSTSPKVKQVVSSLTPDLVYLPLEKVKDKLVDFNVVTIGCGLSVDTATTILFKSLLSDLSKTDKKVLIDADGLNILSLKKTSKLPQNLVITPHPMEAARLLNVDIDKIIKKPVDYAKKLSRKYNSVTVLKMHSTIVCSKELEIYINDTGNSALSKAGSGDVLSGMISGFLAQDMNMFEAAKLGVYLHGRTGEIASSMLSQYSVLASDLLKYIPMAIIDCLK